MARVNPHINLCLVSFILFSVNVSPLSAAPRGRGIDQEPMYGGMNRNAYPKLKRGDEVLIAGVTKEWGSRAKASKAFVEQGIRFYQRGDYSTAIKRFNQAWLIDPGNPDAFWGFAMIYYDEDNLDDAKKMIDKAFALSLSDPVALADAGLIYALYAFARDNSSMDEGTRKAYAKKSDELYNEALRRKPADGYIYESWATALYHQHNYSMGWEKIKQARRLGYAPNPWILTHLREKMPEPKN